MKDLINIIEEQEKRQEEPEQNELFDDDCFDLFDLENDLNYEKNYCNQNACNE